MAFESSPPTESVRKASSKKRGRLSFGPGLSDEVPNLQSQSSGEEEDEVYAAFEPSLFKVVSPTSSVSASASELLFEDLSEKTKLLKIADSRETG